MSSPTPLAVVAATTEAQNKTVTGYPAQPSQIAAGYPPPTVFPVATAYPYAVPPPTVLSQTYGQPNPPRWHHHYGGGPTLLCRLISAIFLAFFIISIIFFVTWLVLQPHLPRFRVDSASVNPFNINKSELSATWDISFFVRNPNEKLSIYYDNIQAWIVYGDEYLLSGQQLPRFVQEKKNETTVTARLVAAPENVDEDVLNEISGDRARGSVSFDVRVLALVRFRTGEWQTRRHLMRVSCESVQFGFSAPNNGSGTLMGGPRACKVDLRHILCMCRYGYYKDGSQYTLTRKGHAAYACEDIVITRMKFNIDAHKKGITYIIGVSNPTVSFPKFHHKWLYC